MRVGQTIANSLLQKRYRAQSLSRWLKADCRKSAVAQAIKSQVNDSLDLCDRSPVRIIGDANGLTNLAPQRQTRTR